MTMKNLNGIVPEVEITERESDLIKISDEKISDYMVQFKIAEFSKAISSAMDIVSSTNKYIDETQPWKLAKDNDHEGLKRVLRTSLEMISKKHNKIAEVLKKNFIYLFFNCC
mgnify:CR=1 FL=1